MGAPTRLTRRLGGGIRMSTPTGDGVPESVVPELAASPATSWSLPLPLAVTEPSFASG